MKKLMMTVVLFFSLQSKAMVFPPGFLTPTPAPQTRYHSIPPESNRMVQQWIVFFTLDDHKRFNRFMNRGAQYQALVQEILAKNGVPPEMYYLAMIESGYASRARSMARAVGIWQFMPSTARRYGLRVDHEVDERLDIIRSTNAAAKYLRDLNEEFGSWYLAMAAYNAGEGRVRTALRKHHGADFWFLARHHALPRETVQYIPKFQAAMQIARFPERYGFGKKTYYEFPDMKRVRVSARKRLSEVARRQRVSLSSLRALNPHLTQGRVPASKRGYEVWVPDWD